MKKLIPTTVLSILLATILAIPAYAYYIATITFANTSATSYPMIGLIVPMNNSFLNNNNYFSNNGTDVQLTSDVLRPRMLTDNMTIFAMPVPATSSHTVQYQTSQPSSNFSIITGHNGYITTTNASALELGNSFLIETNGYLDTTAGANKYIVYSDSSYYLYVDNVIDGKVGCKVSSGYTTPTSSTDPGVVWTDDAKAYDGDIATYAYTDVTGQYLQLAIASTSADAVQIYAESFDSGNHYNPNVNIDVYYSSAWHNITSGVISKLAWTTQSIGSVQDITGVRLKWNGGDSGIFCYWYEARLHNMTSVSIIGIPSTNVTITSSLNTANLTLQVGSSVNSTAFVGSVKPTSGNWILDQNNAMPYIDYYKHTTSGVERIWYKPIAIISGAILPNLDSGGLYPGTITYGDIILTTTSGSLALTTDISSTLSAITSATLPSETTDVIPVITPIVDPSTAATLAALLTDPLYPIIVVINSLLGFGIILLYRIMLIILSLIGFLIIYQFTKHLSFSTIPILLIWGYGMTKLLIPWWGWLAILILAIGLSVNEGRQTN